MSDLALRSKAHWGYDDDFLEGCREPLTVRAEDVAARRAVVAETEGGVLAGMATLEGEPGELYLGMLFVDPDWIGCGVGRRLWDHACRVARDLGATSFRLEADPHAMGFYAARGAVSVGAVTSEVDPDRDLPLLEFRLPGAG